MNSRILALALSTFILSSGAMAQKPGGGGKPSTPGAPTTGRTTLPGTVPDTTSPLDTRSTFFLTGKVKIDDGTALTDEPAVQSNCKGQIRTEGYTDSKGSFSFEISNLKETELGNVGQASDSAPYQQPNPQQSVTSKWRECELQASLPGFTSDVVEVAPHLLDFGNADVGTIVLHRVAQVQGFTISATTAAAPAKAKKEYDKGLELEKKEKWNEAIEKFRKAVEVYPRYAIAWFALGRAQVHNQDAGAARDSFHQALAADPRFVSPYHELAALAFHNQHWQEVVDNTSQMLKLNPVSFPQDWLLNGSANYYLKNFDAAQQSTTKGLQVDTQHHVPELEHLMGVILAQKNDYNGALEHMRKYLALAPNAPDAELARKQVQKLERLSAEADPK